MSNAKSFEQKMQELAITYIAMLEERLPKVALIIYALEAGKWDAEQREALRYQAHSMAGSGAMYGFPIISDAGGQVEDLLINEPDNHQAILDASKILMDAMKQTVDKVRS